ncbi:hypothetical protein INR49_013607 [Caranx melampygus]|nr:hypothetical protein INR49_013607 [Caranx melampygus]
MVQALSDEKNGRPHGTPTRQNSRRSEGGGDRCEWGDRTDGGGIGGSGGVLQRRGSAKERTRLLSSNGTQSQPFPIVPESTISSIQPSLCSGSVARGGEERGEEGRQGSSTHRPLVDTL